MTHEGLPLGRKPDVQDELPVELVQEAAKNYSHVSVSIKRVQIDGKYASCGPYRHMTTLEILQIDEVIREHWGGGRYRVDVFSEDKTQKVVPSFYVRLEGPPKAGPLSVRQQQAAGQVPGFGSNGLPIPQSLTPLGSSPSGTPVFFPMAGSEHAPGATMSSDEIAMHQLQRAQEELVQLRAKAEQERKEQEDREKQRTQDLLTMQKRLDDAERRAEKQIADTKLEALEKQLAALAAAPPKKEMNLEAILAVTAALAPVATAWITSSKDQAAKLAEAQTASMTATIAALAPQKNKEPSVWVQIIPLLPAIAPLIKSWMDDRSPSKLAEMMATMGEHNMTQLSLVGQLMQQALGSQPDSPWLNLLQGAIGNMTEIAQQMVQASGARAPQAPQTQVVHQAQATVQPAQPTAEQREREIAIMRQMSPEQLVQAFMTMPGVPADFKTPEWQSILLSLHQQVPAQEMAAVIANHLSALDDKQLLPVIFDGLFDEGTDAVQILARFLGQIPIAFLHPQYAQDVCVLCGGMFVEEGGEAGESDQEEHEEQEDPQVVVSAEPKTTNGSSSKPAVVVPISTPGGASLIGR